MKAIWKIVWAAILSTGAAQAASAAPVTLVGLTPTDRARRTLLPLDLKTSERWQGGRNCHVQQRQF
jgi:hypothetical protein